MSDLVIFACSDMCARRVFKDNNPSGMFEGFLHVRKADDLAGLELETLDLARCYHRWSAGLTTAWKHMEWCIWQLDPVEVRYERELEGQRPAKLSPR